MSPKDIFAVTLDFVPVKLPQAVERHFFGGHDAESVDAQTLRNLGMEFVADVGRFTRGRCAEVWKIRRRDLRRLLSYAGPGAASGTVDGRLRNQVFVYLMEILDDVWSDRFLQPLVRLFWNHPDDPKLRKQVESHLSTYEGSRRLPVLWRDRFSDILKLDPIAGELTASGGPLKSGLRDLGLESTVIGHRILSRAAGVVGARGLESRYWAELFGGYSMGGGREVGGLFPGFTTEEKAPFINGHCGRRSEPPPQSDPVFTMLKEDKVMGGPRSLSWKSPAITDQARQLFRQWVIGRNFHLVFDNILVHDERKRYWLKWLPKIEDIQVWCRNSAETNRVLKLDFPARELELPTLAMKIGSCVVFECGEQSAGAVYIYPYGDPISWPTTLHRTRDYKAPYLDRIPETNWGRIVHSANWPDYVDFFLRNHYGLHPF